MQPVKTDAVSDLLKRVRVNPSSTIPAVDKIYVKDVPSGITPAQAKCMAPKLLLSNFEILLREIQVRFSKANRDFERSLIDPETSTYLDHFARRANKRMHLRDEYSLKMSRTTTTTTTITTDTIKVRSEVPLPKPPTVVPATTASKRNHIPDLSNSIQTPKSLPAKPQNLEPILKKSRRAPSQKELDIQEKRAAYLALKPKPVPEPVLHVAKLGTWYEEFNIPLIKIVPTNDPAYVRPTPGKLNPTSSVDLASAEYLLSRKFYPPSHMVEHKYIAVLKSAAEFRDFVISLSPSEIRDLSLFKIDKFPLLPGRFKNTLLRQKLAN